MANPSGKIQQKSYCSTNSAGSDRGVTGDLELETTDADPDPL